MLTFILFLAAWATSTARATVTVSMNYANYEDVIVQGRKVMIVGWPDKVPFGSPSAIGNLADMRILNDAWLSGAARWVRMTKDQVKSHAEDLEGRREGGESVGKKRKQRSDAGVKKGSKKAKTVASPDDDSDKENDDNSSKKKKKSTSKLRAKAQIAPVNQRDMEGDGAGSEEEEVSG